MGNLKRKTLNIGIMICGLIGIVLSIVSAVNYFMQLHIDTLALPVAQCVCGLLLTVFSVLYLVDLKQKNAEEH